MKMKILGVEIIKTKSEKVKARADVHFEGFWLKGFKVIKDVETSKEFVTPPSYLSGHGWRALFRTDSSEDWTKIQREILQAYEEKQLEESVEEVLGEGK